MPEIGVLLAGCGAQDGSEIHESVITLLALDRAGVDVRIMAPDMDQFHVVNHFNGDTIGSSRNILVEASRIARGNIISVDKVSGDELDALIFPGGTGMAKNIFNYGMIGSDCTIISDVERITREIIESDKPLGAICIAPVMVAKILQNMGRQGKVTGGFNEQINTDIQTMGIKIEKVGARDIVVDEKNKIVSTPAYVEASSINEVAEGIDNLVAKVIEMIQSK